MEVTFFANPSRALLNFNIDHHRCFVDNNQFAQSTSLNISFLFFAFFCHSPGRSTFSTGAKKASKLVDERNYYLADEMNCHLADVFNIASTHLLCPDDKYNDCRS